MVFGEGGKSRILVNFFFPKAYGTQGGIIFQQKKKKKKVIL